MKRCLLLLFILTWLCPTGAHAHVGSPDIFYDGMVGPWPAHITIRMPGVVPGRAEIIAQVQSTEPVTVFFTPVSSRTAISNAPPAEAAMPVRGETNSYTGDLWLMTFGAYSIEVRIMGSAGDGTVQIPVNSTATTQLPLPPALGGTLLVLGLLLFFGAMAIVGAAAGESTLVPGAQPESSNRRKYKVGAFITAIVLTASLLGGKKWWDVEEVNFRAQLRAGGWPDMAADVRAEGSERILQLTFGRNTFPNYSPKTRLALAPDHGKLLHLFLVSLPDHQAFGHIHPVRKGNTTFEVALPPLPEGDYELYCDLTMESGMSSTATNRVHLPAMPMTAAAGTNYLEPDEDDSWATNSTVAVRENTGNDTICHLPDGTQVIWKAHAPLQTRRDAGLKFEVRDAVGNPVSLEPYMGMLSHAAVLRADGGVFAHLHPSGNFSMAAQMFFNAKKARETGASAADGGEQMMTMPDGSVMKMSDMAPAGNTADITLPYEFPTAGDYRVWVQVKLNGAVRSVVFDATVK